MIYIYLGYVIALAALAAFGFSLVWRRARLERRVQAIARRAAGQPGVEAVVRVSVGGAGVVVQASRDATAGGAGGPGNFGKTGVTG